ncbi:MAG TPA: ABC transporter substrate-binding protein [Microbacteriaceae bacterium]|nr:ABC transporter substrate-binding protein [Microbacteriaceae bacterium]
MRHSMRRTAVIALAAAAAMTLASCAGGAPAPDPSGAPTTGTATDAPVVQQNVKIMTTQAAWTISYSPLIVSEELGYFAEEGLTVEWVNDSSAATVATQVQQGNIDIGIVSPEPVVIGHEQGNLTSIYYSSMFRKSIFGVAVPEDSPIKDASDLAGARIGVTSLSSSGAAMAKAIAASGGVDEGELTFLAIGAGGQAMAALKADEVDALSLFDTQYVTFENNGIPLRILDRSPIEALTSGGLVALPEKIKENPGKYLGAARAVAKGILFTQENPEATVRIFWDRFPEQKPTGMSDDEAMADTLSILNARMESYGLHSAGEKWGEFPGTSFEQLIDFMAKYGLISEPIDATGIYTNEYVPQINDFDADAVIADAKNFKG